MGQVYSKAVCRASPPKSKLQKKQGITMENEENHIYT